MFLIDRKGATPKPICLECRKLHGVKECPRLDRRILVALSNGGIYRGYRAIAKDLGIPWRRVQNAVGRLMREDRRLG
jgi:hypothetical protein